MELFEGSAGFGKKVNWWIGVVAPRSAWADGGLLTNDKEVGLKSNEPEVDVYYNRVKVKVVGYHDNIQNPRDLPWANLLATPMLSSGYGFREQSHMLEGGESVFGFWMDGDDEQKPCIVGVFYRHKRASDNQPPLKGSASKDVNRTGLLAAYDQVPTGETAGTEIASKQPIPDTRNKSPRYVRDPITGRLTRDKTVRPSKTNEPSTKNGLGDAAAAHHTFLNRKTNRPTCKRDGAVAEITGALGDFTEFLLTVQGYANFYVNGVTNALTNLEGEIDFLLKDLSVKNEISNSGFLRTLKLFNLDSLVNNIEDINRNEGLNIKRAEGNMIIGKNRALIQDPLVFSTNEAEMKWSGEILKNNNGNLNNLNLDLSLRLKVSENLPWYAALIGGIPAVFGSLVIEDIFDENIKKASSLEFKVKGTIDEPIIERLDQE